MTKLPTFHATDTEFTVASARFPEEHPRLWEALNEWCRFHNIDPHRVPMITTIRRNVEACRVEYEQLVLNDDGQPLPGPNIRRAVSQGEAPPLPFPTPVHDHDCQDHACWRPGCCNPRRPDCAPETL